MCFFCFAFLFFNAPEDTLFREKLQTKDPNFRDNNSYQGLVVCYILINVNYFSRRKGCLHAQQCVKLLLMLGIGNQCHAFQSSKNEKQNHKKDFIKTQRISVYAASRPESYGKMVTQDTLRAIFPAL